MISLFLSPRDTAVSKDVPKITTEEHFSSNSKSQLIAVGWKVIRSSSQRRAHQTSSLQALSGFISLSSPLSRPVMTLSRRDGSPLRADCEILSPEISSDWPSPGLHLSCSAWARLKCHNDRAGWWSWGNITFSYHCQHVGGVALCPSLLLYPSERAPVIELLQMPAL